MGTTCFTEEAEDIERCLSGLAGRTIGVTGFGSGTVWLLVTPHHYPQSHTNSPDQKLSSSKKAWGIGGDTVQPRK